MQSFNKKDDINENQFFLKIKQFFVNNNYSFGRYNRYKR
jgi:hypothetical protein